MKKPIKKILVATDLSARSDRAVLRAVKMSEEFKAKLIVLHTVDSSIPRGLIDNVKESAKKEIDFCLKDAINTLRPDIRICLGSAYSEILKVADKEDVDLIILGLHSHIDDDQPMIGNVIERLMKYSHKPLLIVKDRSEGNYTNILSALDFNDHSEESLKIAFKLFKSSQFYLLHTYEVPFLGFMGESSNIEQQVANESVEILNKAIDKLLKDSKTTHKIKQIVKKGYILDVLQEEVKYLKPDLLVLGTNGRTAFARAILPSATNTILINPPCDVLVVSPN